MLAPTQLLHNALEFAGISKRFLAHSGLLRELRPDVVRKLVPQIVRGLRGPMVIIRLHALSGPERPAIVTVRGPTGSGQAGGEVRLSYRELDARTVRLAHALHRIGVGPGDRVGLLLDNGHEFLEVGSALQYLSATAVQIGYRLKAGEVAYILGHSGARSLIFHGHYADVVRGALTEVRGLPPAACFAAGPTSEHPAGFPSYEALIDRASGRAGDHADPPKIRDGGHGGLMLYTSGTTGKSKGARRDLKNVSYAAVMAMLSELPLYKDDRHLVVCPLYHAAAPAFCAFVFAVGGCVVIPPHFDAAAVPALIERERITSSTMVPTMLSRLVQLPVEEVRRHDLSSLRWLMSVAAPLPTELARRVEDRFGPILYNMYGATETAMVTLARPGEHTARPGTIGQRIFGNEILLLDEAGQKVPRGQVGELYARNGNLMVGYHNDDRATSQATKDGFFTVGDLAWEDADGYYYLADRKSDMVISAGVNIYPLEVEQRLHAHPQVTDCAVVGVPDPEWGESLCAFVVLKEPGRAGPALIEELRAFVAKELADFKRPRRVEFVDSIPRNPTGKILKRELRQRAGATVAP